MSESKNETEGRIWVTSFDEEAVKKFESDVQKILHENGEGCPIIVYINSYGGAAFALLAIIDIMDSTPCPFITVGIGKAMSAGAIMLAHGDIRFCAPNACVMIHEMLSWAAGNIHDMENEMEHYASLNQSVMEILARDCGIKGGARSLQKMFKEHKGHEIYMDASSALKFGLVDEVGIPLINVEHTPQITTLDKTPTKRQVNKARTSNRKKKNG